MCGRQRRYRSVTRRARGAKPGPGPATRRSGKKVTVNTMDDPHEEEVADAAMTEKLREIYRAFDKPWIRKRLQSMLPPMPVTSMACDFIVHPRDNFTELRMWETGFPPEHVATEALSDRLCDSEAVVVDVGANAGAFSLPILKAIGRGAGLLVEPNPVMRARLARNVALNNLSQVVIADCAVGAEETEAVLQFPKNGNLGQGRVDLTYAGGSEGVRVMVMPLVEVLRQAGLARVDLLKVDVEGLEDKVICPFLADPDAPKPELIYFEIAHDQAWDLPLMSDLDAAGYVHVENFGPNALFERGDQAA